MVSRSCHGRDSLQRIQRGLWVRSLFWRKGIGVNSQTILPGYGPLSCTDPEIDHIHLNAEGIPDPAYESENFPGFYKQELGIEALLNPFDIPLVLQDRVIDPATGQIAYDNTGHNGYIGDTMVVNGIAYPFLEVRNRKYRFRILDGSNARVFGLRILSAEDFHRLQTSGIDDVAEGETTEAEVIDVEATEEEAARQKKLGNATTKPILKRIKFSKYDLLAKPFLRIGKDSWLWSRAVEKKRIVLAMANRADIVVDFNALTSAANTNEPLQPGETREFYLVNTMPQTDGRGPKTQAG